MALKNNPITISERSLVQKVFAALLRKRTLVVVGILLLLWIALSIFSSLNTWKAVFLDNNQVYFGKSISLPFTSTMTLRHVYFLRDAANSTSSISVLPIKQDVHSPKDKLIIYKEHIIYIEELNSTSKLIKAIQAQEAQK